jgi:hypothetical protein
MNKLKFLFLLFLLLPNLTFAHGPVTTVSQNVSNYTIEFEYNTLGTIFTSDYITYDVYLLNASDRSVVDFDSAFIRIQKLNGPAVIAANLTQSTVIVGSASMSTVLNEAGTYQAYVAFYKKNQDIAEYTFNFDVKQKPDTLPDPKSNNQIYLGIIFGGIGLVLGTLGSLVFIFKKKKNV